MHFAQKLPTLFLDSAFLDFSAKPAPQRLETLATLALKATASTENSETCPRKARDALSDDRGTPRRVKRQPECRATRKAVARPSCEQGPRVEKPSQRRRLRCRAAARAPNHAATSAAALCSGVHLATPPPSRRRSAAACAAPSHAPPPRRPQRSSARTQPLRHLGGGMFAFGHATTFAASRSRSTTPPSPPLRRQWPRCSPRSWR